MKTQALTLALAALALLSTTAANAQVERYSYIVNGSNVLSQPAIIQGSSCAPAVVENQCCSMPAVVEPACAPVACGPTCARLFGKHTWWDDGTGHRPWRNRAAMLGYGGYGGYGALGYGYGYGVNSLAAVVPGAACNRDCETGIAPICGQKVANSVFDIRLFKFGLGFGRVNPRWDMRPIGEAW